MDADMAKFAAVETRLRELIRGIVKRRTSPGVPLSWQLMFEIEDEAMAQLRGDASLDQAYIRLVAAPVEEEHRQTDGAVGLNDLHAIHTTLWMIQEAYYHA